MNNYYFEVMGMRINLCAFHNVNISQRLRPFLSEPHENCDCTITLKFQDEIPQKREDGIWHGLEYYDCTETSNRVFHHNDIDVEPFAVTVFHKDGNVDVYALSGYESYFEGSSGIFNRIGIENLLLEKNGLLLHASLIEYDKKGIAFIGPSGVGKSTQAALWYDCFGAEIINGDRAALRIIDGKWTAFGSPYAGSSGIYKNKSTPLSALVILSQAKHNRVTRLNAGQAFSLVYPELSVHHWDKSFVSKATDVCLDLLSKVPIYHLECLPNEDAAQALRKSLML